MKLPEIKVNMVALIKIVINIFKWKKKHFGSVRPNGRKYACKKDKYDKRDFYYKAVKVELLPEKVDLRQFCPGIYDQGNLGSCTGNAIASSIEFNFIKQGHPVYTPSRLFIYYNERVIEHSVCRDAGAMIRDGIKSVASDGVCPETDWPYITSRFAKKPSKACYQNAKNDLVTKYERITTLYDLKHALSEGFTIVFGFIVFPSFEDPEVSKTGIVPTPKENEEQLGGHAVHAIGYDDNRQCLIIKNSWGESWGDQGYFYLPYGYFSSGFISDVWCITLVT